MVAGHARRTSSGQFRDPDCPSQSAGNAEKVLLGQKEAPHHQDAEPSRRRTIKTQIHTIKTQIITDKNGEVIAIETGHPGPKSDKTAYQDSVPRQRTKTAYQDSLAAGQYPQAARRGDLGYLGIPEMLLPNKRKRGKKGEKAKELTPEQKAENQQGARARVYVEHGVRRVKA